MTVEDTLRELRRAAAALEENIEDEQSRQRMRRSVIRPLDQALRRPAGSEGPRSADPDPPASGADLGASVADDMLGLARRATRLRVEHDGRLPLEVVEAVAALQDLAVTLAPGDANPRRAMFADLQAALPTTIHTESDGPYLLTNLHRLRSWLGVDMTTMPQVALCRCGRSASKPLCDGTHAEIGITDGKDPNRVPDRLDTYTGVQVTVRDNRGTCAHSGFCTDQLPTVFRREADTFVAPSGGRIDEMIRAVHGCPSGALSLAAEERGADPTVDRDREPAVEVSKDGPYRITGRIPLLDARSEPVPRDAEASLEHYSLCRCGHSRNKPFCSGTHWYVDFRHDPPLSDEPTLFELAGGFTALRRMTHIFYEKQVPAARTSNRCGCPPPTRRPASRPTSSGCAAPRPPGDALRVRPLVLRRREPQRRRHPGPAEGRHHALRRRLASREDRCLRTLDGGRHAALTNEEITTTHHVGRAPHSVNGEGSP